MDRGGELLIVGDIHGHFDDEDVRFLRERGATLTLFVGDLGDEDPDMTQRVADVDVPKVVILGNHDAWESFRKDELTPSLRKSLDILGDLHLAYAKLELPELGISLIGARPFSWGGPSLRSPEVYELLYDVKTMEDSAEKIIALAESAEHDTIVILAHNGPTGLGTRPYSIYGKDFGKPGGDWGDQDLGWAIAALKDRDFNIPLVIGGHMHHRLVGNRSAKRQRYVNDNGTFYLNPARVPRIFESRDGRLLRHFATCNFEDGELTGVHELVASSDDVKAKVLL